MKNQRQKWNRTTDLSLVKTSLNSIPLLWQSQLGTNLAEFLHLFVSVWIQFLRYILHPEQRSSVVGSALLHPVYRQPRVWDGSVSEGFHLLVEAAQWVPQCHPGGSRALLLHSFNMTRLAIQPRRPWGVFKEVSCWQCPYWRVPLLPFEVSDDQSLKISLNTNDADYLDAHVRTADLYLAYLCCEEKQRAFPVACMIFPAWVLSCEPCERRNRPSSFSSWERTAQNGRRVWWSLSILSSVRRQCKFRGRYLIDVHSWNCDYPSRGITGTYLSCQFIAGWPGTTEVPDFGDMWWSRLFRDACIANLLLGLLPNAIFASWKLQTLTTWTIVFWFFFFSFDCQNRNEFPSTNDCVNWLQTMSERLN